LRITPRTALNYLTEDAIRDLARSTARQLKERDAAEDARPPVRLDSRQAGLMIAAFTVAGLGCSLRDAHPPVGVPALLLANGLGWARFSAENLASGKCAVLPGVTGLEDDQRVAARLQADLAATDQLVG
jgi:hypothetical protein